MYITIFVGIFAGLVGLSMIDKVTIGTKVGEYNLGKVKASIKREEAIKDAVVRYIIDNNTEPRSMTDLINNNYISQSTNDNGFGGRYFLDVNRAKGTVTLDTSFSDNEQRDLYAKMHTRSFRPVIVSRGGGN